MLWPLRGQFVSNFRSAAANAASLHVYGGASTSGVAHDPLSAKQAESTLELVSPPEMNADGCLFLFATARLPLLENDGSTTSQASAVRH